MRCVIQIVVPGIVDRGFVFEASPVRDISDGCRKV
jgi:hypothetical protein